MPKFLVEASYSADGFQGLAKDKASGRKAAIASAAKKLGGKLESIYFCMGENDVILIVDMPDYVTAAALSAAASTAGTARTNTTPLLTVEEMDKALGMSVSYRAPGK
ncbi:MAG: GYD domain-containing protein [Bryobacteraceae bacterium]